MRTVSRDALLPPAICFICTGSPPDGQVAVDTLAGNSTAFPGDPRSGRIYVCESCGNAISEALGYVSVESRDEADRRASEAEWQLRAIKDHVAEVFSTVNMEDVSAQGVADRTPAPAEEGKDLEVAVAEQEVIEGRDEFAEAEIEDDNTPPVDAGESPFNEEQAEVEEQSDEGESVTTDTLEPVGDAKDDGVEP